MQDVSKMTAEQLLKEFSEDSECSTEFGQAVKAELLSCLSGERWQPIKTAPKDATEMRVLMRDGTVYERAHWASDLSGEDQPPFQGWFIPSQNASGFREIEEPTHWRPLPAPPSEPSRETCPNCEVGLCGVHGNTSAGRGNQPREGSQE